MARSKVSKKLLELNAQRRVVLQEIADVNRRSVDAKREESELLVEREREERQNEIQAVLPDAGASVAVVTDPTRVAAIAKRLTELRTRSERLKARLREIEEAEHQQVVADLPALGRGLQDAAAAVRKELSKLGRSGSVIRNYRAVLSSFATLVEARRELDLLRFRLRGNKRTVHAQKAALSRLQRDLAEEATPDEINGFIIFRGLELSRHANSGIENFWQEKGFETLPHSFLYAGTIVNSAEIYTLQSGRLPII